MGLAVGVAGVIWLLVPLRFEALRLNEIVSLCVAWSVLLALSAAAATLPRRVWIRVVLSAPIALSAVAYPAILMLSMMAGGPLSGYELVARADLPHSAVVAYKVNAGATVDSCVRVYHTKKILPGIVLSRILHNGYHEYEIQLRLTARDSVEATIRGGLPMREYVEEYRLRPFVIL